MRGGWYLMHRGWMDSADFRPEPYTDREAYQWSIEQAAIKPHRQWFNGSLYDVGRGEFVTSLHAMGEALHWPMKRSRLFVARMVKAEKWAKRGAHGGAKAPTVLVVLNYDEYQRPPRDWGKATGEAGDNGGAKQGQSEGKEQKEESNKDNEGERKERAAALPYSEAIAIWTEAAERFGWSPKKPKLDDKRRRLLAAILKEEGLPGWSEGIGRACASEWLAGPDPPGWFHFDFIIQANNFNKTKEGNYDRQFNSGSSRPAERSNWNFEMPC